MISRPMILSYHNSIMFNSPAVFSDFLKIKGDADVFDFDTGDWVGVGDFSDLLEILEGAGDVVVDFATGDWVGVGDFSDLLEIEGAADVFDSDTGDWVGVGNFSDLLEILEGAGDVVVDFATGDWVGVDIGMAVGTE